LPGVLRSRPLSPDEAGRFGMNGQACAVRRGRGCHQCDGTGYYERRGLFELLTVDERIRALIHDHAPVAAIRSAAMAAGMRTLRQEGVRMILVGQTTPPKYCA